MSTARHTVRDLIEEAKKRVVLFLICLFGLSYLMSLTSSSVWVNLPAAAVLIIFCRYVSLDLDIHKKSATGSKLPLSDASPKKKSVNLHDIFLENLNWRSKVNSPATEEAIDHFTRHLVSEWVTDLWYSRITPDKDGPEELVQIINNVFGEISIRARDINLIELLTRDIINLFCNHLELYRMSISKIGRQELKKLPLDHQDILLKQVLAAESKLHPALFSTKAEHKVLQHLVNGLMLTTFRPNDLQCYFFQYTSRELLACAVFRPVLNLANPRVINEKIESLVLSFANKADKEAKTSTDQAVIVKSNAPSKSSTEQLSESLDRSSVGLELVQFKHARSKIASDDQVVNNEAHYLKHRHSSGCISEVNHETALIQGALNNGAQASPDTQTNHVDQTGSSISKGEWGQILDIISQKKRQALAPEHLENVWAKGRNYRKKEGSKEFSKQNAHGTSTFSNSTKQSAAVSGYLKDTAASLDVSMINTPASCHENLYLADNFIAHSDMIDSAHHLSNPHQGKSDAHQEENEIPSESSYETEDEESSNVTGLDSPGTRVWDSKNKRNASVTHVRHPLETSDYHSTKIKVKSHVRHPRTLRTPSGRKKIRPSNQRTPLWQEIDRSSFLLGEGQDLLNESTKDAKVEELRNDPDVEIVRKIHSGAAASSPMPFISASESSSLPWKTFENSVLTDSFLKLRCEVFGANIVKSGSGTFAVYSIAVTDANNHCWSIKRRFRHFEELHRRLKEFSEYNLSLPPKHFLSSGLDVPVVQERCKLLDKYIKRLLGLPTISGSIEVWDFLSVDSQTYMFSDSLSILQTLSAADLDDKPSGRSAKYHNSAEVVNCQLPSQFEQLSSVNGANALSMHLNKMHSESEDFGMRKRNVERHKGMNVSKDGNTVSHDSLGSDAENMDQRISHHSKIEVDGRKDILCANGELPNASQIPEDASNPTFPTEWATPNLSVPILDLIDVIFQLKDGGWIRRQAFWVAKQLLQLGMGDAFDDWLIDKIQLLRKGSVVANAIRRIEKILWPDGIFITKHPNRKPPPASSPGSVGSRNSFLESEQQLEAARRAKFVYELIIDKPPAPLVGLVGRKEYEHCAQDIYFFLQSVVCMKQLAVELLELLLLSAFPELEEVIRQCHEEKDQFGVFEE